MAKMNPFWGQSPVTAASLQSQLNQAINIGPLQGGALVGPGQYINPFNVPAPMPAKPVGPSPFKKDDEVEVIKEYSVFDNYSGNHWHAPQGAKGIVLEPSGPRGGGHCDVRLTNGQTVKIAWEFLKIIPPPAKVAMESVILAAEKKTEIKAAISQIEHHETIFTKWGFSDVFEKGTAISLLFYGIPGTGKTLMAQAIADEMGYKFKVITTAEIESSEPGAAERNIQAIFQTAKTSPTKYVILFDECDSLLTDRNEVGPILGAQINVLLSEIEHYNGIVIFTTNRLGKLDPALERRITSKIEFPFPEKRERELIWARMIPKKAPVKNLDFKKLATFPIAGGNIKNAVLNAARHAAYIGAQYITMEHLIMTVKKEQASLKAFSESFDANPHQQQVGYSRGYGKTMTMKKEMNQQINIKKKATIGGTS